MVETRLLVLLKELVLFFPFWLRARRTLVLEQQPGTGFASLICSKSFSLPQVFLLLLFEACYRLKTNSYFRGGGCSCFSYKA